MSDQSKALLIDIGNTRIKYAFANHINGLTEIKFCSTVEQLETTIEIANQVLVSCVGHSKLVSRLTTLCEQSSTPLQVVKTQAQTFGIQCAYSNFSNLGVDRWLAILAARRISKLPLAVIGLGTANTCDIVVQEKHQGGWIGPGFSIMRDSLLSNTQQVFADDTYPNTLDIGVSTVDCVNYGCLASQSGFVLMGEQYLEKHFNNYELLIYGGGQTLLDLNFLNINDNKKINFYPNLVLKGLTRFIK